MTAAMDTDSQEVRAGASFALSAELRPKTPILIEAHQREQAGQPPLMHRVRAVLRRRLRYAARLIYWAIRHRSVANARWVLDYEGIPWD